jgi:hypothetical protein
MPRAGRRLALLAAALAGTVAGCGHEQEPIGTEQARAAQRAAGHELYWVGERFAGLALTGVVRNDPATTFAYGTCRQPKGEGGCAPPLQVQTSSICDDNALVLDVRPRETSTARGTAVRDYGEGSLELDAGTSHVRLFARGPRGRQAVAALRPVAGSQRVTARLPPARYPNGYLAELRRVVASHQRGGSLRAVRSELGISLSAVRFRLALARELGADGLRRERGLACDHPPG